MTILISILLAFLLLCFVTYIDFQIWYKKQKRSEYPNYVYLANNTNPVQMFTGAINVRENIAGQIIKVDDMEIKEIYGVGLIEQTLKGGI